MKPLKSIAAAAAIGCLALSTACQHATQPAPPAIAAARARARVPAPPVHASADWVVPPLGIKTPMRGEPDAAARRAVRLVPETCEDNQKEVDAIVNARVAAMRGSIERAFEEWKAEPTCEELANEQSAAASFGDYGVGGGGMSASASGVGLGSFGGIGHGAGSVRASAPSIRLGAASRAHGASGTNDQVAGVDEADIVKNDGAYVYVAASGALRIVEAMHPRLVSVTRLGGNVKELLVENDRVVAFVSIGGGRERPCTYGYDCVVAGDGSRTQLVVLDVRDRSEPRVARTIDLSGSLIAARRIGGTVHAVVADGDEAAPSYSTWPEIIPTDCKVKGMDEAAVHERFHELARQNEADIRAAPPGFPTITERGVTRKMCDAMHTPLGDGRAFTSVVSLDLHDDARAPTTAVVQTRPGAVFASEHGLYFAVVHRRSSSAAHWYPFDAAETELSDIHQFRIGDGPEQTRYVGSGVVPGHVLNQFAMDEWYGYLRVATTRGRVPDPNVESSVSVLAEAEDGNLVRIGALDHLAAKEDIRAVRFDKDRAYLVTFKKTDPLFVLDLAQPTAPAVLGELQIPGFSTYLHRIDPSHLLSIGFDANDHGSFAYFDGVILQLFDVSDPTHPQLLHREKLGTRGSSSEAATDHLAFNYWDEKKLLAVPITLCEGGGDGTFADQATFSGLLVYDVDVEKGFHRLGGVDHGGGGVRCDTWWSNATSQVKRSIFMDDLVFSIASDRMKVQRMGRLGEDVADIALAP